MQKQQHQVLSHIAQMRQSHIPVQALANAAHVPMVALAAEMIEEGVFQLFLSMTRQQFGKLDDQCFLMVKVLPELSVVSGA